MGIELTRKITFIVFVFFVSLFSQEEAFIKKQVQEIYENQPLTINLELIEHKEIQQAFLFYRTFGKSEFSVLEMRIQGNNISATIPSDYVLFPYIEYYIKILTIDGNVLNFPSMGLETGNFYKIDVMKRVKSDEKVIVLYPEFDEPISSDEFFLALSLLRTSSLVKKEYTRLWINEDEVTSLLSISGDLIVIPQNRYKKLIDGQNTLKVILYDTLGKVLSISNFYFNVVSKERMTITQRKTLRFNGQLKAESNYENLRVGNLNLNRMNLNLSGDYGDLVSSLNLYITNEEKRTIQPQNRFQINLNWKGLSLNVGDHYPSYSSLIMNGKRLRGITGKVELGFFNVQLSYGEVTRRIEGELLQLYSRDSAIIGPDIIPVDSSKFGNPFAKVILGTYQRNLFAIRPYFGSGKNFQLGFTYLHSKDKLSSIQFGAMPKENLVLGSDLLIGIDNQRILFKAQGAFSILNNDITTGNFTDEIIDSLFGEGKPFGGDPDLIKKVRDIGKKFITINQFIVPLNPQKFPTFAGEATFSLNYFNNFFRTSYIYRGNEYTSFGQNFLRNDIKGLQVMDRIGLLENQVFVSISYENLSDNLQKTKIATTTYQNFESSVALYLRKDFPRITLGYSNYLVKNDIPSTADSIRLQYQLNDLTNQFSFSSNYDLKLKVLHRLFFSIVTSYKKDRTFKNLSVKFLTLNFNVHNFWNKKFSTFFGTSLSQSEISSSRYAYYSFNIGTKLNLFNDKNRFSLSVGPSFGNLKRTIFDLTNQYLITNNFSFNINVRYIINQKPIKNESIFNIFTQYSF